VTVVNNYSCTKFEEVSITDAIRRTVEHFL